MRKPPVIFVFMQGQQALFTTLFPSSITSDPARKGVCNVGTDRRDEALVYRYYYYIEIQRTRYDDVLVYLEREYFITEANIVLRLGLNRDLLKRLIEEKPKLPKFKKLYPDKVWMPKKR